MMIHHRFRVVPHKILLILLCALIPIVSACEGGTNSEAELLTKADDFLRTGDHKAAVIELKTLLQSYPKSARGRWLLGRTQLELGDAEAASKELRLGLELGWPAGDIAVPLARALLLQDPSRVVEGLRTLGDESQLQSGTRGELSVIRGLAMLRTGDKEGAVAEFKRVNQISADSTAAGMANALLALNRGDWQGVHQALEGVLEAEPKRAEALALQGDLAMEENDFGAAVAAYGQALDAEPGNPLFRLALARAQLQNGADEVAIATLEPVLKANPRLPDANYLRAVAAFQLKDFKSAQIFAEKALEVAPGYVQSYLVAGAAAYGLTQYERAFEHLKRIAPGHRDSAGSRFFVKLLAATQMKLGMVDEAINTAAVLEKGEMVDAAFLGQLGTAIATLGRAEAARWMLDRASTQNPDDFGAQIALGLAKSQLGDAAGSMETLEQAISLIPEKVESQAIGVLLHMKKREFEAALAGAQKLADDHPSLSIGQTLLGTVYGLSGRIDEAKSAFERALEIDEGDLSALHSLGQIYYTEQQWEKARDTLRTVADKRGGDLPTLLKLAVAESRLGRELEGMAWLEKAVAQYPDDPAPRVALAKVYVATGRAQDAVDVAFDFSVNRELTIELRDLLGKAQLLLKQYQAAAKTLEVLAKQRPDDILTHWNLARAYEGAGQFDAALQAITHTLSLDPSLEPVRFSRARLLTAVGRLDEARGIVAELKSEHPSSFELTELEGAIAMGSRDFKAAVAAYERAFELRKTNVQLLKWSRARMAAGQVAEAESQLQEWLSTYPNDVLTQSVLASYLLNQKRNSEAEVAFKKVVGLNPGDALARNNLASLLLQSGKNSEALIEAERAHELDPENPNILDTLGEVLLEQGGQVERAVSLLGKAASSLPDDRDVQVNYARALAQTGDVEKAYLALQKVLADDQPFRNRVKAEALLKTLTLVRSTSG